MQKPPRAIKKIESSAVKIIWNDGETSVLPAKILRTECPCAECRERRGDSSHAKPLSGKPASLKIIESSIKEQLHIQAIWGVGNYALGLRWEDGHDSGIYTYDYLLNLSKQVAGQQS